MKFVSEVRALAATARECCGCTMCVPQLGSDNRPHSCVADAVLEFCLLFDETIAPDPKEN